MQPTRFAFAVVLLAVLTGCAASTPAPKSEPTERQRANAQKQEALQDMLDRGQRN